MFCNALGSFWAAVGNTLVFVDSDDCWKPSAPKAHIFVLVALFCIGASFWAAVEEQETLALVGNENCWKLNAPNANISEILQEFVHL